MSISFSMVSVFKDKLSLKTDTTEKEMSHVRTYTFKIQVCIQECHMINQKCHMKETLPKLRMSYVRIQDSNPSALPLQLPNY